MKGWYGALARRLAVAPVIIDCCFLQLLLVVAGALQRLLRLGPYSHFSNYHLFFSTVRRQIAHYHSLGSDCCDMLGKNVMKTKKKLALALKPTCICIFRSVEHRMAARKKRL